MADSGSSLAAALARDVQGEALDEIIAAARERLRLSRIPCESCDGTAYVGSDPVWGSCSDCGGVGEVWSEELVEAMAQAYWETYYLVPPWKNISGSQRQLILVSIGAVLDAIDLHAKGGQ